MNGWDAGSQGEAVLSPAATQALDELLAERRAQVLDVARRQSPNVPLGAADVVRAYYASEERGTSPQFIARVAPSPSYGRRRPRYSLGVIKLLGFLLVGTCLFVFATLTLGPPEASLTYLIPLITSIVGVAVGTSGLYLLLQSVRRPRLHAPPQWELAVEDERGQDSARFGVVKDASVDDLRRAAFLRLWSKVEDSLRNLAKHTDRAEGGQPPARQPIGALIPMLEVNGVIHDDLSTDIRHLIAVRNMVAHQESVPPNQLDEDLMLLNSLEHRLEKLQRSQHSS